jgi:hypothetical protein
MKQGRMTILNEHNPEKAGKPRMKDLEPARGAEPPTSGLRNRSVTLPEAFSKIILAFWLQALTM